MNSSSKVIVVATLIMVVSLVMVLTLVLVLLAELYCSLLLNRRRNRHNSLTLPTTTTTVTTTATTTNEPSPSNISSSPKSLKTHLSNFHNEQSLPIVNNPNTTSTNDFIYISNPVYSNEATSKSTTPFETPESSPSRLETGEEEEDNDDSTPTLSPMKDLPQKACSVSLKDVRSLENSSSESNRNNNNDDAGSSSSSASPYTSPSW